MLIDTKGITKVFWLEIRDKINLVEPTLTELIDSLSPGEDYPLYILNFPYGEFIGDDISQFIPSQNEDIFIRLNSDEVPQEVKTDLGYGKDSAPLGMVLSKSIEFFVDLPQKALTLPIRIAKAGEFYNFSRILSISNKKKPYAPNGLLKATAGARSIFSLPYLTCTSSFSRLEREIGGLSRFPENQYDHFQLFKDIVSCHQSSKPWRMQLLYFSKNWVNSILNDEKWSKLRAYLFQLAWNNTDYKRNQFYYDISFSLMQEKENCRSNPYLNDTARHILDIAIGAFPGLSPVLDDSLLPLKLIQHSLSFNYGLKKHLPTLIAPSYFDYNLEEPIYYSLQYPIARSFSPQSKSKYSMLNQLNDLKRILEKFINNILKKDTMWSGTILHDAVNNLDFSFIHNHKNKVMIPLLPAEAIKKDDRFLLMDQSCVKYNNEVSLDANFFRGCVGMVKR
jgi:hypothetical protein